MFTWGCYIKLICFLRFCFYRFNEIWFKEGFERDSGYFHYLGLSDTLIINGEVITNLEDFCNKLVSESSLW